MEEKSTTKFPVSKKAIRIILRTLGIIAALYFLFLIGLSVYVRSSKERLIGFIRNQISKTILGELKITSADITIWQSFPKVGLTLNYVTISDSFYHKPFLSAEDITARVGVLELLGKNVTVNSVRITNGLVHIFTDAKGYSNAYVFNSKNKEVEEEKKDRKPFVLKNLDLKNITVIIEDAPKNKRYQARIDEAEIETRLRGSKYFITFDEDLLLRGLGFNMAQGYWLENQHIKAKWKLEYDTSGSVLAIKESPVKIQGQPFSINGEFNFGKSHFALNAATKNIPYASALNILKPKTRAILQKLSFTQPLETSVALSGSLSKQGDPAVKVYFKTANNNLTTPVLNISNCTFSGTFNNQYNTAILPDDSNSRVSLNSFISKWANVELKGRNIAIENFDKPIIQFEFFSECTLPELDEALGSSTLSFEEGKAKLYLAYKGPLITDPSLLDRLNTKLQIQNGKVVYVPRNIIFSECNGAVNINGNNLLMKDFQCNVNTNHFVVNIDGNNLNRLSASEAGKATINCNVFTPALDLADFKTLFAGKTQKTVKKKDNHLQGTATAIDSAFENGDLFINVNAKQVTQNHFMANNVIANVYFKGDDWEIKKASLQHADGTFDLTAKVHQFSNGNQQVNTRINLKHINVKKLFYSFDNFGQSGITYKNLKGTIDAKANIIANINNAGKFIIPSMNGNINFSLKKAALIKMEALMNIQKVVFKNRNLDNIEFAALQNNFTIKNGDIYIPRMPIQSSAITMYVEGVYSFAGKTDISIQVPISSLKNKPEDFRQIDEAKMNKPGSSIFLRAKDKDGQVKIGLDVFNNYKKEQRKKERKKKRENKDKK